MTIICRTPDEVLAALNRMADEVIEPAVVEAQKQVVEFAFHEWAWGKATWVHPDPFWTGQYRSSVRVSIGSPDGTFTPEHPDVTSGEIQWPEHPGTPYYPLSAAEVAGILEGLRPYQTVYISNDVPHADKVEAHTQVMNAAAEFTRSHFSSGYSWGNSLIPNNIPF